MKKFISCLLVVSLLFTVSASAAGVDAYTVDEDVTVFSMLAANASDYAVMPLSSSWSTELGALNSIDSSVLDIRSDVALMEGYLKSIDDQVDSHLMDIWLDVVDIHLDVDSLEEFLTSTNTASSLYATLVKANKSIVDELSDLVAETQALHFSLDDLLSLDSGYYYLSADGTQKQISGDNSFADISFILTSGIQGLWQSFRYPAGSSYLNSNGGISTVPADNHTYRFSHVLGNGFIGLRSVLLGSNTSPVFSGSVLSNDNVESSFSISGIGPMVNKWFDAVQLDTGHLAYMFASPTDLEAKKDSESTTQAVTDSFLDPESDTSVSLSDVGSLKNTGSQIKALGQTGVTVDQAFEQLGNADLFAFFTEEAANDLDSRVSTYSRVFSDRIVTNYYEQSRTEFFDLIGKEE